MLEVIFHKRASKIYNRLDDKTVRRINKAIEALRANPFSGKNIRKMRGELEGKYRLRIGDLRAVYRVEKGESLVIIESIGGREEIHK